MNGSELIRRRRQMHRRIREVVAERRLGRIAAANAMTANTDQTAEQPAESAD